MLTILRQWCRACAAATVTYMCPGCPQERAAHCRSCQPPIQGYCPCCCWIDD